jgi:TolB-like protein/Tfp pilus assembly protein PilF
MRKAKALDEFHPWGHTQLGWLYVMTRQYDKGVASCERAINLDPNSANAHIWMSLVLMITGRHKEAVQYAEQALRLDPFPPDWYFRQMGSAYSWVGRYEEAITFYKKALQGAPNDIITHLNLARTYSWASRIEEARAQAVEVLRINPKYSLELAAKTSFGKNQADRERYLDGLRKAGIPETPPLPLPDKPSIAVLPFVNMSGDPEQEYFSDGLTEEIITALSKTPKMFVIARTSSFKYKGKEVDVRTVGRELGVRYVLEGSVRRSKDHLRITAQLVDAKTGSHLWAERYERGLKDIFAIQDEITMKIIIDLQVKLTEGEQARIWGKKAKNLDVYLKSLKAVAHLSKGTREGIIRHGQLGQEIVNMAPESMAGYRLLAWNNWYLAMGGRAPQESIAKALKLAKKALEMDEFDSQSHTLLGSLYLVMRQYEKAIAAGERAVALNPNGAFEHDMLGNTLNFSGRPDEAIGHLKQALRLNPFPDYYYFRHLGQSYMQKGQYDQALAEYRKALHRSPDSKPVHIYLVVIYILLDRQKEAGAAAKKLLEINPKFSVEGVSKALPYKNEPDLKLVVNALRKAGLK